MADRIQRRRDKGWRMPDAAVYVGRPTKFGNPWQTGKDGCTTGPGTGPGIYGPHAAGIYADWLWCNGAVDDAEGPHIPLSVVRSYMSLMERRNVIRAGLAELRGRDLACWCPLASPCHADVLLELANG